MDDNVSLVTKKLIQARLLQRDSNLHRFALLHDYHPRTVLSVVDRWAGTGRLPRGVVAFHILKDLSQYIQMEIAPGLWSGPDNAGTE